MKVSAGHSLQGISGHSVPSGFAGTPLPFHGRGGVCSLHTRSGPLTHIVGYMVTLGTSWHLHA